MSGGAVGALALPVIVSSYSFGVGFGVVGVTGFLAGLISLAGPPAARRHLEQVSH